MTQTDKNKEIKYSAKKFSIVNIKKTIKRSEEKLSQPFYNIKKLIHLSNVYQNAIASLDHGILHRVKNRSTRIKLMQECVEKLQLYTNHILTLEDTPQAKKRIYESLYLQLTYYGRCIKYVDIDTHYPKYLIIAKQIVHFGKSINFENYSDIEKEFLIFIQNFSQTIVDYEESLNKKRKLTEQTPDLSPLSLCIQPEKFIKHDDKKFDIVFPIKNFPGKENRDNGKKEVKIVKFVMLINYKNTYITYYAFYSTASNEFYFPSHGIGKKDITTIRGKIAALKKTQLFENIFDNRLGDNEHYIVTILPKAFELRYRGRLEFSFKHLEDIENSELDKEWTKMQDNYHARCKQAKQKARLSTELLPTPPVQTITGNVTQAPLAATHNSGSIYNYLLTPSSFFQTASLKVDSVATNSSLQSSQSHASQKDKSERQICILE